VGFNCSLVIKSDLDRIYRTQISSKNTRYNQSICYIKDTPGRVCLLNTRRNVFVVLF